MSDVRRRQTPEAVQAFMLLSQGRLPPAHSFCPATDEPTWKLSGVAALLGIPLDDLLEHLHNAPPRFSVEAPTDSAGESRVLAK